MSSNNNPHPGYDARARPRGAPTSALSSPPASPSSTTAYAAHTVGYPSQYSMPPQPPYSGPYGVSLPPLGDGYHDAYARGSSTSYEGRDPYRESAPHGRVNSRDIRESYPGRSPYERPPGDGSYTSQSQTTTSGSYLSSGEEAMRGGESYPPYPNAPQGVFGDQSHIGGMYGFHGPIGPPNPGEGYFPEPEGSSSIPRGGRSQPPRTHICPECGKGFGRPSTLAQHEFTHTGERPYICDVCHKGFNTASNLKRHRALHDTPRDGV